MADLTKTPDATPDSTDDAKEWGKYAVLLGLVYLAWQVAQDMGGKAYSILRGIYNMGRNVSAENQGTAVSVSSEDSL